MTIKEVWKPVVNFEGLYEVSNLGRVARVVGGKRRFLKPLKDGGRASVCFSKDAVVVRRKIHRVVLEAFLGPCPDGMECCHNNGDGLDNRLVNLRWDTKLANAADRVRHGTAPIGSNHGRAILTEGDIPTIRKRIAAGDKHSDIAGDYGLHFSTISAISRGRLWAHVD